VALLLLGSCLTPVPAQAQLATSFYNVTGVTTRTLPNAVQITIRTDGAVRFGGDLDEFLLQEQNRFEPKPTTTLRLRLVGARARLPAFVNIGAYPVDSAVVTLGTDTLRNPFLRGAGGSPSQSGTDPLVDIQLRFSVPITVQRFYIDRRSGEDSGDEFGVGFGFGEVLGPRQVSVELTQDRRSILITVFSDRVDIGRSAGRLRRSPPETHKHRLSVTPAAPPSSGPPVAATPPPAPAPPSSSPASPAEISPAAPQPGSAPATTASAAAALTAVAAAVALASPLASTGPATADLRLRVDALHTPLADLIDQLSRATGVPIILGEGVADIDVSLLLPNATLAEALARAGAGAQPDRYPAQRRRDRRAWRRVRRRARGRSQRDRAIAAAPSVARARPVAVSLIFCCPSSKPTMRATP
jgi:hypothetical protein